MGEHYVMKKIVTVIVASMIGLCISMVYFANKGLYAYLIPLGFLLLVAVLVMLRYTYLSDVMEDELTKHP